MSCLEIIALLLVCLLWVDGWFSTVSCPSTPVSVQRNKTKKLKSFQIVHLWANVRNFDILSLFMIMIPVSFIKKCNMHQCSCYDVGLCVRVYQSFVFTWGSRLLRQYLKRDCAECMQHCKSFLLRHGASWGLQTVPCPIAMICLCGLVPFAYSVL